MNNQTISNNRIKPFERIRMLFSAFFAEDISDDNSGLDSYINNTNLQSEEDKENAKIAQELKDSLSSISSKISSINETSKTNNKPKRNSGTLSIKSQRTELNPEISKGNIHTMSTIQDNQDLSR